jgi:copper chaperone CopZ
MIKIVVTNMFCGHCQLKIKTELEAKNYEVIKINMDENTVLIRASKDHVSNIVEIFDKIHYVIDVNQTIELEEHIIWDSKLEDDNEYNRALTFFSDNEIEVIGFSEKEIGIIVLCTDYQLNQVISYLNEINVV